MSVYPSVRPSVCLSALCFHLFTVRLVGQRAGTQCYLDNAVKNVLPGYMHMQQPFYLLELFFEVIVHPGVEERVVDSGAHGYDVSDEKCEKKVVPAHHGATVFLRHVKHVEWQPAHHEYRHHGDQHPVCATFATDFELHHRQKNRTCVILINNSVMKV